jgi:hypothetical protein
LFIPGPKEIIPFVGQRQGREQVAQFFATLAEMQDAEQFELRELIAQGNKVVALECFPIRWNHLIGKESFRFKEQALIEKVEQLFRNML